MASSYINYSPHNIKAGRGHLRCSPIIKASLDLGDSIIFLQMLFNFGFQNVHKKLVLDIRQCNQAQALHCGLFTFGDHLSFRCFPWFRLGNVIKLLLKTGCQDLVLLRQVVYTTLGYSLSGPDADLFLIADTASLTSLGSILVGAMLAGLLFLAWWVEPYPSFLSCVMELKDPLVLFWKSLHIYFNYFHSKYPLYCLGAIGIWVFKSELPLLFLSI